MVKHPLTSIKTTFKRINPEDVIRHFSESNELLKSFLIDQYGSIPQDCENVMESLFDKTSSIPLYISIYDSNIKMKYSVFYTFLKYLLTLSIVCKQLKKEEISEWLRKLAPCMDWIQYGLDMKIGNNFDYLLRGAERIEIPSDKIVDEWLVTTYHCYLFIIKQFISNRKLKEEGRIYFRNTLVYLLVTLVHVCNRKRIANANGETNFHYSRIELVFMISCSRLLKKAFKHEFLMSYCYKRIFLECIYHYFDSRTDFTKILNFMIKSTEKKGFRTLRSLMINDVESIGSLTGNSIIPNGINQGDTAENVATRVVRFLCSLYAKTKNIDQDQLPILIGFLPFILKILNWNELSTNLKEMASQVCSLLVGTFEHSVTATEEHVEYLKMIKDAVPMLVDYVATQIRDLSTGTQTLCFNMISWISTSQDTFDIDQLDRLLQLYRPGLNGMKEYLEMIRKIWIRIADSGNMIVLNSFLMKRLSEMLEVDIKDEEVLPRVKIVMLFLTTFPDQIPQLDCDKIVQTTIKKTQEFLSSTSSNTSNDFEVGNSLCKILSYFIDEIVHVENIFPILHDLIEVTITTEPIHHAKIDSILAVSADVITRFLKFDEGYFLDMIRILNERSLLEKCHHKGNESSDELINNLILPYVLEQSLGDSRVPGQATLVIVSLLITDILSSSKRLIEKIKNHVVENCAFLLKGSSHFNFFQRPYENAMMNLLALLFPYYPEEMVDYILPNAKVLFSSSNTASSPGISKYAPLFFNLVLNVAEYLLDNDLIAQNPESLLSLHMLFSFIHLLPLDSYNIVLLRRVVNKYDVSVRDFTS